MTLGPTATPFALPCLTGRDHIGACPCAPGRTTETTTACHKYKQPATQTDTSPRKLKKLLCVLLPRALLLILAEQYTVHTRRVVTYRDTGALRARDTVNSEGGSVQSLCPGLLLVQGKRWSWHWAQNCFFGGGDELHWGLSQPPPPQMPLYKMPGQAGPLPAQQEEKKTVPSILTDSVFPQEPPINTAARTLHYPLGHLLWASPVSSGLRRFKEKKNTVSKLPFWLAQKTEPLSPGGGLLGPE